MPYRIDIDGIHKNIFTLSNLCFASKDFCKKHKINRLDENVGEFDWNYYLGWLKFIVSESLLNISIKYRTLQDIIREEDGNYNFEDLDKISKENLQICSLQKTNPNLTIREICNKIIHSLDISLLWKEIENEEEIEYEYWNGKIILSGRYRKCDWRVDLCIADYCIAMERAITHMEDNIDWHHLYKYDE